MSDIRIGAAFLELGRHNAGYRHPYDILPGGCGKCGRDGCYECHPEKRPPPTPPEFFTVVVIEDEKLRARVHRAFDDLETVYDCIVDDMCVLGYDCPAEVLHRVVDEQQDPEPSSAIAEPLPPTVRE